MLAELRELRSLAQCGPEVTASLIGEVLEMVEAPRCNWHEVGFMLGVAARRLEGQAKSSVHVQAAALAHRWLEAGSEAMRRAWAEVDEIVDGEVLRG